jgi:hypothetical protein
MKFTVSKVKELLPNVRLNINGNIITCRTGGRLNKYATLFSTTTHQAVCTASWETITNCLNTNNPIRF